MTTLAENIEKTGEIPTEFLEAAQEVQAICKEGYKNLDDAPVEIRATEFMRNDDGNVIEDDNGRPQLVALVYEDGEPVMQLHPLHHRHQHHGLHAYRYEILEDGSAIALYANTKTANVKVKAFKNIEEASQWHPRLERKDSVWAEKSSTSEIELLPTRVVKREQ